MKKYILIKNGNALSSQSTDDTIVMTDNELIGAREYYSRNKAIEDLREIASKQAHIQVKREQSQPKQKKDKLYEINSFVRFKAICEELTRGFDIKDIEK